MAGFFHVACTEKVINARRILVGNLYWRSVRRMEGNVKMSHRYVYMDVKGLSWLMADSYRRLL